MYILLYEISPAIKIRIIFTILKCLLTTLPKKKAKANELDACPEKKLNLPPHDDLTNRTKSFN
tara:strand:+ start:693 stop:881 length:189 start_codon:yes stop_codon:yes gene_type:complete